MGLIVKSYKNIIQIFTFKPSIHKYTKYLTPLQNNIIIILYLYVHENLINYLYILLVVYDISKSCALYYIEGLFLRRVQILNGMDFKYNELTDTPLNHN